MAVLTKTDELRDTLIDTLSQDDVDYSKVQTLSNELAKLDPDFVRFSADAALISRLGRELVARQETAVAELVKNAYDADASEVVLIFSEADEPGGRLEIRDNGSGMNRDQLIGGFMRLSSSEKVEEPISPKYKRQRAGRKGIGRFAVQRLGNKLEVSTQTRASTTTLKVDIDWDEFKAGQDLSSVSSRITELRKSGDPEGTTLLIGGLREAWDERALKRVYRYVADLLQPFPLAKDNQKQRTDPGFKVKLVLEVEGKFKVIADEETEIFQHALAEVEGYVDSKGQGYWSIKSEKLEVDEADNLLGKVKEKDRSVEQFQVLKNTNLKVYYYIDDKALLPRSVRKSVLDLLREKGGIRVYRNGFRVSPYGDKDDDWLGLDESTRKRYILAPHGNANFFGFVEIVDLEGGQFEETSSREGLLNNKAFEELQDFTFRVLISAVFRVAEARGKKQTSKRGSQQDAPGVIVTKAYKSLNKTAKELVKAGQSEEAKYLKTVSKQLQVAAKIHSEQSNTVIEELAMLRVLAGLGITIGEFTHEVRRLLISVMTDASCLVEQLPMNTNERKLAERLGQNIQGLRTYASYFDETIADNTSRELFVQDVQLTVRKFVDVIEPAAERVGIDVNTEILEYDLFTCPMHASEWASILFNFFTNSRKAIDRAGNKGKILIRAGQENSKVFVEFADNGDGISAENEDRIFNAFFTTASPADRRASDIEEIQGTGLGLKIVHDIANSYGGDVSLVSPPDEYTTCFRAEFPVATEAELKSYDA